MFGWPLLPFVQGSKELPRAVSARIGSGRACSKDEVGDDDISNGCWRPDWWRKIRLLRVLTQHAQLWGLGMYVVPVCVERLRLCLCYVKEICVQICHMCFCAHGMFGKCYVRVCIYVYICVCAGIVP